MGLALWFGSNIVTLVACVAGALLWRERMLLAGRLRRDAALPGSSRRQHWRNHRWCAFWLGMNAFIGFWAAVLNLAALQWRGPVPLFICGGTAGFTLAWLAATAAAFWDFWAVGTIARMREDEREAGC